MYAAQKYQIKFFIKEENRNILHYHRVRKFRWTSSKLEINGWLHIHIWLCKKNVAIKAHKSSFKQMLHLKHKLKYWNKLIMQLQSNIILFIWLIHWLTVKANYCGLIHAESNCFIYLFINKHDTYTSADGS